MTVALLDEETEAIIAWLEGPPEMLAALRFRIRRLMDEARDDELEVEALRSNPPDAPDTGELEMRLDLYADAVVNVQVLEPAMDEEYKQDTEAQCIKARKSVLDLFERLQNRIAELERQSAVDLQMAGEISAARNSIAEENEHLLSALKASNADYEKCHEDRRALRSTALTREEAAALYDYIKDGHDEENIYFGPALYKLRSLSSLRSSSLGEQK